MRFLLEHLWRILSQNRRVVVFWVLDVLDELLHSLNYYFVAFSPTFSLFCRLLFTFRMCCFLYCEIFFLWPVWSSVHLPNTNRSNYVASKGFCPSVSHTWGEATGLQTKQSDHSAEFLFWREVFRLNGRFRDLFLWFFCCGVDLMAAVFPLPVVASSRWRLLLFFIKSYIF